MCVCTSVCLCVGVCALVSTNLYSLGGLEEVKIKPDILLYNKQQIQKNICPGNIHQKSSHLVQFCLVS